MDDDAVLKFLFYSILVLSMIVIVGIWESFVQPLIKLLMESVNITF